MDSRILTNAAPVEELLIERARKLSPALLCDAMGNTGAMDYRIKPVWAGAVVIGTALTVKLNPRDNLLLHRALCQAAPGYVLVAETGECTTNAVWGDMMTRAAMKAGAAGTVVDGVVRDVEDIRDFRYPVFAIGTVPQSASRECAGSINVPIVCGGVGIEPGDLVFGNADGVCVVPRMQLEEALQKAEVKLAGESSRIREISEGKIAPQWLAARLKALGLE